MHWDPLRLNMSPNTATANHFSFNNVERKVGEEALPNKGSLMLHSFQYLDTFDIFRTSKTMRPLILTSCQTSQNSFEYIYGESTVLRRLVNTEALSKYYVYWVTDSICMPNMGRPKRLIGGCIGRRYMDFGCCPVLVRFDNFGSNIASPRPGRI